MSYQTFLYRFLGISGIIPLISKTSQQTLSVDLRTLKKCEFCLQLGYLSRGNYYLVPRFPTATFDVVSRLSAITSECVVPENIPTSETKIRNYRMSSSRKYPHK